MNQNTDNPSQQPPDEWPEPENTTGFDWSLSMRDLEKKYLPLRPGVVKIVRVAEKGELKTKPCPGTLLAKFRKKYPYIYNILEEENADLPRWLIDNMLKLSL